LALFKRGISILSRMNTIFDYSAPQIEQLVTSLGQPKFRTKQLIQWLYKHGARSYDEMNNLPKNFRESLAQQAPLIPPVIVDAQVSADGTRKFLLEFADGAQVETVGIPSRDTNAKGQPRRLTVCFSTQVGCPMRCSFCATGREGFTRNLTPGEMVWQVLTCQNEFDMRVSNIVAMGQGEPFLNYDNVMAALRYMNSDDALAIGARHISLSTCGIIPGIQRFADEGEQFTLAVSLHSAQQDARDDLMPGCRNTPLDQLKGALRDYQRKSGRRITFEYLMIDGITDTVKALDALISYCKGLKIHVNLLKINHIDESPYEPTIPKRLDAFRRALEDAGIETTIRDSRGADIDGACGQLKNSRK